MEWLIAKSNGVRISQHIAHLLCAARFIYRHRQYKATDDLTKRAIYNIIQSFLELAILFHDIGKADPAFQSIVGKFPQNKSLPSSFYPVPPHSLLGIFFINIPSLRRLLDKLLISIEKDFNSSTCSNLSLLLNKISRHGIDLLLSSIAFHHWRNYFDYAINFTYEPLAEALKAYLRSPSYTLDVIKKIKQELEQVFSTHGETFSEHLNMLVTKEDGEYGSYRLFIEDMINFNSALAKDYVAGSGLLDLVTSPYKFFSVPIRFVKLAEHKPNDLNEGSTFAEPDLLNEQAIFDSFWCLFHGTLLRVDSYASYIEELEHSQSESVIADGANTDHRENLFEQVELTPISDAQIPIKKIFDYLPSKKNITNPWQTEIFEECPQLLKFNLVLVAPTGVGKTEFALAWALSDKVFYTLPARVSTNQIFCRVEDILSSSSQDSNRKAVGLLHGESYNYLKSLSSLNVSEGNDLADPKERHDLARLLANHVTVATGDQIYPYILRFPGYERVLSSMYEANLIVDEVQSYSPEAMAMVLKSLEFITQLGGKFVLITATWPSFFEEELISRVNKPVILINMYTTEDNIKYLNFDADNQISENEVDKLRKVISNYSSKISGCVRHKVLLIDAEHEASNHREESSVLDTGDSQQTASSDHPINAIKSLVEYLLDTLQLRSVLVSANTVATAQEIFNLLRKNSKYTVHLIHSRFTQVDRSKAETTVLNLLRDPSACSKLVCVSTQVIETSLDISFDVLITELAPLDSLIQRFGRVNRRSPMAQSPALQHTNVIVVKTGFNSPYLGEQLEVTWEVLKNSFNVIPWQNQPDQIKIVEGKDLSELTKYSLLEKYYGALIEKYKSDQQSNLSSNTSRRIRDRHEESTKGKHFLTDFFTALKVLDSGFVSESRRDAQKLFRGIQNLRIFTGNSKHLSDLKELLSRHAWSRALEYLKTECTVEIPEGFFRNFRSNFLRLIDVNALADVQGLPEFLRAALSEILFLPAFASYYDSEVGLDYKIFRNIFVEAKSKSKGIKKRADTSDEGAPFDSIAVFL
ncbi:MAG: CRISPR-associated helicase Cas3' [Deltaproteobacteria bacterium]|nr:CRISPR-associated helicase Cas3' [Deltaproteobacteria bacterium]